MRHPFESSLLSPETVLAGVFAVARPLGLSMALTKALFRRAHDPARKAKLFADYPASLEDVLVACYPKSGTNWALNLATQIAWEGEAEFPHIHSLVPWPESEFPKIPTLDDPGWRAAPYPRHVIKTAIEVDHLPVGKARILSILRDPKQVVVSAHHFITGVFGIPDVDLSGWVDWTLSDENPLSSWAEHADSVWRHRNEPHVLVLHFNEMKQDLPTAVDRVADFLGIPMDESARERVIERCGFAWMKAHEDRFGPPQLRFKPGRAVMLREGKTDGFRAVLTEDEQRRIDEDAMETLERLGSDFPYEAYYSGS